MPAPAPVTTTIALLKSKPLMPAAFVPPRHLLAGHEPDAALTPHVAYQILDQRHARRQFADEGMAGQHEARVLSGERP